MKRVFWLMIYLTVFQGVMANEVYKVCFSSVTKVENAVNLTSILESEGIDVVYEMRVVNSLKFIRILTEENYTGYRNAVDSIDEFYGTDVVKSLRISDIWVRIYRDSEEVENVTSKELSDFVDIDLVSETSSGIITENEEDNPAEIEVSDESEEIDIDEEESSDVVDAEFTADIIFDKYKENFIETHEFLKEFSTENDTQELIKIAENASIYIEYANKMLEDFEEYMPEPLSNFEKENDEAKEMRLASKTSFLKTTYLPRAVKKLDTLKEDIKLAIDSDYEWLNSEYANIKYAPAAVKRIKDNFAVLKKLYPDDESIVLKEDDTMPGVNEAVKNLSERIAANRMPESNYTGDDTEELTEKIGSIYKSNYPDETVEKVVIVSEDWTTEARAEFVDGKIVSNVYKFLQVSVAATNEDGKTYVYLTTFRKDWTGEGDEFGEIKLHSVGERYQVVLENIF